MPNAPSEELLECLELVLTSGISPGGVDVRLCRVLGGGVVVRNGCLATCCVVLVKAKSSSPLSPPLFIKEEIGVQSNEVNIKISLQKDKN